MTELTPRPIIVYLSLRDLESLLDAGLRCRWRGVKLETQAWLVEDYLRMLGHR